MRRTKRQSSDNTPRPERFVDVDHEVTLLLERVLREMARERNAEQTVVCLRIAERRFTIEVDIAPEARPRSISVRSCVGARRARRDGRHVFYAGRSPGSAAPIHVVASSAARRMTAKPWQTIPCQASSEL